MSQFLTSYDLVRGKKVAERYTIVGLRRQGGFSAAYEAKDDEGARCELQLFPAGLFESPEQAEEFRGRLLPWRAIESPHVQAVRDVLALSGGVVLICELPGGHSLRERLNEKKRFSGADCREIGHQLLEALGRIHGAGLVHGDIKPPTIFMEGGVRSMRALLVDGGVTPGLWTAKGLGEKTALIGTPYYAPVEQFGGEAPDVRSDIYNVATVLYESVTGMLPWSGHSFLEVFQAKLQDLPPMRSRAADVQVEPALEAAILRGCLADRRKRYASASEFQKALEA